MPAKVQLKVKRISEHAKLPTFSTNGSACFDITTNQHSKFISPGNAEQFSTGLEFEIPTGHVMLVFSRSGHSFKNSLSLVNCVGVIDSDYRGELMIKIRNNGYHTYTTKDFERIAQAMIVPIPNVDIVETNSLSSTERGDGGFGSTGK